MYKKALHRQMQYGSLVLMALIGCSLPAKEKLHISPEQVKSMCAKLHTQMKNDGFEPDLIIGVSRGGLIPLGYLAGEAKFNNRSTRIINLQSYDDKGKQYEPCLVCPIHPEDFQGFRSVLIIDDLVDSGESLDFVLSLLRPILGNAIIKTAVLFYKPRSKIKPDYYIDETTQWVVFPWSQA